MNKQIDEESDSRSLTDLISLLAQDPENIYPGGATEEEIAELETELGITLSPGYIEFLKKFGGGEFRHVRIYSIASEDETFFDFMEQVFSCTRRIPLVQQGELLPFADDYDGNIFCFNLHHARDGEYPVVQWNSSFSAEDEPKHIAQTFSEFIDKVEMIDE